MSDVHDFAGLACRTGPEDRWLALGGPSGSGKSTLARWLTREHPGWQGRHAVLESRPLDLSPMRMVTVPHIVVVDEITTIRQLVAATALLAQGHRLILATHLPKVAFVPLGLRWRGRFVSTARRDQAQQKLARALTARGLSFTDRALRVYLKRFGPVYPEIDLVLERCPTQDFDRALAWFDKFHRVTTTKAVPHASHDRRVR